MPEPEEKEPELELEPGSAKVILEDVYKMFYVLVAQNQKLHPGSKMSFDVKIFKNLPKRLKIHFINEHSRLFAWIPEKPRDRKKVKPKSNLLLPSTKLITPN